MTGRSVSDTVRSDAGCCWHTAVLHGVGAGAVQQKGCHYLLGSPVSTVQRYVVPNEVISTIIVLLVQREWDSDGDHPKEKAPAFRLLLVARWPTVKDPDVADSGQRKTTRTTSTEVEDVILL